MLGTFEPLELKHKSLFDKYLSLYQPQTSELTFVNLWVWCMCHPVWIYESDETLFILRKESKHNFYGLTPLGSKPLTDRINHLFDLLKSFDMDCIIKRMYENDADELQDANFNIIEDIDQFDYVYNQEDLTNLAGRKYGKKRNHTKKCLKKYNCEYLPITKELIPACHGFLEEWCKLRDCANNPDLCCENRAIRFMLYDYSKFNVIGGALKINGEIAAVTFGEKLNNDTAVIHFEKAHPEIDGTYPLINQWFVKNSLQNFKWINREQDLGSPGLRKAKKSYYPIKMIKKYTVTAK